MREQKVVVGIDFSPCSMVALDAAILQAGDGELHALCVLDSHGHLPAPRAVSKDPALSASEASDTLSQLVAKRLEEVAREAGKLRAFVHVRTGSPARELAELSVDVGADMLVVGTHGRTGLDRLWSGSVAERVLRVAPCPVLVATTPRAQREATPEPEPEPPCDDCKQERLSSRGEQWWCQAHRGHAHADHGYSRHLDYKRTTQPLW